MLRPRVLGSGPGVVSSARGEDRASLKEGRGCWVLKMELSVTERGPGERAEVSGQGTRRGPGKAPEWYGPGTPVAIRDPSSFLHLQTPSHALSAFPSLSSAKSLLAGGAGNKEGVWGTLPSSSTR